MSFEFVETEASLNAGHDDEFFRETHLSPMMDGTDNRCWSTSFATLLLHRDTVHLNFPIYRNPQGATWESVGSTNIDDRGLFAQSFSSPCRLLLMNRRSLQFQASRPNIHSQEVNRSKESKEWQAKGSPGKPVDRYDKK